MALENNEDILVALHQFGEVVVEVVGERVAHLVETEMVLVRLQKL